MEYIDYNCLTIITEIDLKNINCLPYMVVKNCISPIKCGLQDKHRFLFYGESVQTLL